MRRRYEQMFVSPDFKKMLKAEAAMAEKTIVAYTEELAHMNEPIKTKLKKNG